MLYMLCDGDNSVTVDVADLARDTHLPIDVVRKTITVLIEAGTISRRRRRNTYLLHDRAHLSRPKR